MPAPNLTQHLLLLSGEPDLIEFCCSRKYRMFSPVRAGMYCAAATCGAVVLQELRPALQGHEVLSVATGKLQLGPQVACRLKIRLTAARKRTKSCVHTVAPALPATPANILYHLPARPPRHMYIPLTCSYSPHTSCYFYARPTCRGRQVFCGRKPDPKETRVPVFKIICRQLCTSGDKTSWATLAVTLTMPWFNALASQRNSGCGEPSISDQRDYLSCDGLRANCFESWAFGELCDLKRQKTTILQSVEKQQDSDCNQMLVIVVIGDTGELGRQRVDLYGCEDTLLADNAPKRHLGTLITGALMAIFDGCHGMECCQNVVFVYGYCEENGSGAAAVYPRRWIGRGGPVPWPARSPDLSPLNLFLVGLSEVGWYTGLCTRPGRSLYQNQVRLQVSYNISFRGGGGRYETTFLRQWRARSLQTVSSPPDILILQTVSSPPDILIPAHLLRGKLILKDDLEQHQASTEHRRNEGVRETGDPRENPPTSGIVQHESHMPKYGCDPGLPSVGGITLQSPRHARRDIVGPYTDRLDNGHSQARNGEDTRCRGILSWLDRWSQANGTFVRRHANTGKLHPPP
ncbi:hypothetical protein PR048_010046 [Dryococelus australis]|uniref:Uncharacterized protein n=1 Tax=Dryococelus australis TaxID=614101 RepID=A0ABQ9I1L4_9NEOP|nr:hypothetical protein PR048_010046 [Dryococelus australis]